MTATKLVMHHRYRHNLAFDLSDHANHGQIVGAQDDPSGPNVGTLKFDSGDDRVVVSKSGSLDRLAEFHVKVRFYAVPETVNRRYNLIEAELCFALFIETGWRIGATTLFVDTGPGPISAIGWHGIFTAPNSVAPYQWHTVDFLHDGLSHSRVFLNGTLIGEKWDNIGPLQPLGDRGIYVGHWPSTDPRYTLRGNLAEVIVWREDPERDPGKGLDDCCVDRGWIDERVEEARRNGWDAQRAIDTVADLGEALRHAAAKVRGGDEARTARIGEDTRRAMAAIRMGHGAAFSDALRSLQDEIDASLSPALRDYLSHEVFDAIMASPLGLWLGGDGKRAMAFLEGGLVASCLGDVAPPRRDDRPKPPKEPEHPRPPAGDPDTDAGLPDWAAGQPRPAPKPHHDEPADPRTGGPS